MGEGLKRAFAAAKASRGEDATVECKCGWRGFQSTLVDDEGTGEKHCPLCHALFTSWPHKRS
jgi:hypothetical protein